MAETAAPFGEFSVFQFFPNLHYEEVATRVGAEVAMRVAVALTQSVGGQIGTTASVIITDGEDFVCFEWQHGRGVVFPTLADLADDGEA